MSGADVAGSLLNFGLSSRATKKAKQRQEEALAAARGNILEGYDTAGKYLDSGQSALEQGYALGTQQRKDVAGQMTDIANQGFSAQKDLWAPWMIQGMDAYKNMGELLSNPDAYNKMLTDYAQTPQFKFQVQQATDAARRAASAGGNRLGGNQLSALSDRAGDVANQSATSWINSYLDRLQNLSQFGFNATNQLSGAQSALTQGLTGAAQYGDTSQWDLNKGRDILDINKQRGDLALQKGFDLGNLALGQGKLSSDYNLARGALNTGLVNNLAQSAGGGQQQGGQQQGGSSGFDINSMLNMGKMILGLG